MFDCKNREVEKVLVKMQHLCYAEGASFHPEMKIVENSGGLKVMAPPPNSKEMLMKIPTTCMGAVQDFELRVEGEHLAISSHKKGLPKPKVDSFELMIELYNLCDKVKSHKSTSLWFALSENPEQLDFIVIIVRKRREGQKERGSNLYL